MIPDLKDLATHQIATIIADRETDLLVTTVNKPKDELPKIPQPAWFKASIGKRMYGMYAGYPYEETLIDLNAEEAKAYKRILNGYQYESGLSIVDSSAFTASERTIFSRGLKDLKTRNLVKRVKKFTYLINPEARIHHKLFESLLELWNNTP